MANYTATSRTNYFRVTDEAAYQNLFGELLSEFGIKDFSREINGTLQHGFGSYGSIEYEDPESGEYDFGAFCERLQPLLPEDEAFIYMEAGNENLRYLCGYYAVVTSKDVVFRNMENEATEKARKLLGDPEWKTQLEY